MFDLDSWIEIYNSIRKNPTRTLFTALGVFWGIFMLIILLGAGNGLHNAVVRDFSGTAANSFFIWTQSTSIPYKGLPKGRTFSFTNDDIAALKEGVPEIQYLAPRNQLGGFRNLSNSIVRGEKSGSFSVMGDMPEIFFIESTKIVEGRFLNKLDVEEKRKVAVIGGRVKSVLFEPGEDPIDEYIRINGIYFKVIGLYKSSNADSEEDDATIYLPFSSYQQAFNGGDRIQWFSVAAYPDVDAVAAEEKALAILKKRHKVAPEDQRALGHFNLAEEYSKVTGLLAAIKALVLFVGIATLVAGAIGVSNIMLVVVKERTKEIGVRRALGATPFVIVSQIVLEAVVLTGIAGYMGMIVGVSFVELVASLVPEDAEMFYNPGVEVSTIFMALGILVVSGALAGFLPAQRAMSISTVDALRAD